MNGGRTPPVCPATPTDPVAYPPDARVLPTTWSNHQSAGAGVRDATTRSGTLALVRVRRSVARSLPEWVRYDNTARTWVPRHLARVLAMALPVLVVAFVL